VIAVELFGGRRNDLFREVAAQLADGALLRA